MNCCEQKWIDRRGRDGDGRVLTFAIGTYDEEDDICVVFPTKQNEITKVIDTIN